VTRVSSPRRGRIGAVDLPALVEQARDGQPLAVARLISLVENGADSLPALARLLEPHAGRADVLGITGPPGVGKSTTTDALLRALRQAGRRVGVLAIDPSSPFSGGALLGDRIRMGEHATDRGVFIRSMATRGQLGGLAAAVPQALRILDAAGFDIVIIETVGVGQAELEIAHLADTTLVVLAPGLGDGIQAAKAGILEIADVLVVNKADRDGAHDVARDLRQAQAMRGQLDPAGWAAPIVKTVAARGEGVDEVLTAIDGHRRWLAGTGTGPRRRQARLTAEVIALALGQLEAGVRELVGTEEFACRLADVPMGRTDPYAIAAWLRAATTD
jgi:LAO/AO transport system kinase